jgi:hypothetical protein
MDAPWQGKVLRLLSVPQPTCVNLLLLLFACRLWRSEISCLNNMVRDTFFNTPVLGVLKTG